jgi:predicted lipoprotein with Yx(FWY)xxD motif
VKLKLGLVVALMLLAAACGGGGDAETTTTAPTATTTTAATATTTSAAPEATAAAETTTAPSAGAITLAVASSDLGDILVDGDGNTLYVFEPDAQGASTCYDSCEGNWPPLVGDVAAGDGVDGSLLGTAARTDGTDQVTYNGWPLYYFAHDAAPGDVNGQGVGDVWYVVSPAGDAVGM